MFVIYSLRPYLAVNGLASYSLVPQQTLKLASNLVEFIETSIISCYNEVADKLAKIKARSDSLIIYLPHILPLLLE